MTLLLDSRSRFASRMHSQGVGCSVCDSVDTTHHTIINEDEQGKHKSSFYVRQKRAFCIARVISVILKRLPYSLERYLLAIQIP